MQRLCWIFGSQVVQDVKWICTGESPRHSIDLNPLPSNTKNDLNVGPLAVWQSAEDIAYINMCSCQSGAQTHVFIHSVLFLLLVCHNNFLEDAMLFCLAAVLSWSHFLPVKGNCDGQLWLLDRWCAWLAFSVCPLHILHFTSLRRVLKLHCRCKSHCVAPHLATVKGFNYDTCCDPKFGPSGNSQCPAAQMAQHLQQLHAWIILAHLGSRLGWSLQLRQMLLSQGLWSHSFETLAFNPHLPTLCKA